jgi:hypothetical protein
MIIQPRSQITKFALARTLLLNGKALAFCVLQTKRENLHAWKDLVTTHKTTQRL